jgi:two-component system KDP operon response regulator KdpE
VTAFSSEGLEVDLARRRVSLHGRPRKLSQQEFDVLGLLVRADEAALTYREILERVWGPGYGDRVEYLRRTINHLRRKIEPDPRSPIYLTNATRVGYRLTRGPSALHLTGRNPPQTKERQE